MVYYIRFLKAPKLDTQLGVVRALITVATDLGDSFYPDDLDLYAKAVTKQRPDDWQSVWKTIRWKKGMRCTVVEIGNMLESPSKLLQLVVTSEKSMSEDDVSLKNLPEILSARSGGFDRNKPQAGILVERRLKTEGGHSQSIYEEAGESIARHIWDAGIALSAFLSNIGLQPKSTSVLASILHKSAPHGPRVIELGSGCGIVGLRVAETFTTSHVLLTDLPETMDLLNHNVSHAKLPSIGGRIVTATLNWNDSLPESIGNKQFDMIIVSDCTYNSDSIPVLVGTLMALVDVSPAALVVVSMKVRHESEAIFFDLMTDSKFLQIGHSTVPLPDRSRLETGEGLENIEIYVYYHDTLRGTSPLTQEMIGKKLCI